MQETFHQYTLRTELASKYSHSTYLASPINEPESQMILTVFVSSLFRFPYEHENLLKKAQRIKDIEHPHVASILDMGIEQEQPFVVREYWPSGSLRSRLKKLSPGRLELREALTIVSQVGHALLFAHERNIVHGNMKPENILLDADGQAILTDFSLLDRTDAFIRDQTSQEYAFCYLAPEQFTGKCDARSDQYALGCLAYELITGRVPFVAQSLASMMGQPSNAQPAPLLESVADLPPSLETAVLKALAQDPKERFFDFSLFLEVIQAVLSPPPAFPLFHSANSREKRMISYSAQSTKAETVPSSIIKHATKQLTPQSLEPSVASFSTEVDMAESLSTASLSQVSMPEWAGILPVSESLELALLLGEGDPLGEREQEKEVDDLVVTDVFVQEKADAAVDKPLFLTKSSDPSGSHFVRSQRKRARVLSFAVPLSVIMVVAIIASAFWTDRISTPKTRSPSPKKMIQVAPLTKPIDILTVSPSVQAMNVPTVQPSVQATKQTTTIPTAQPLSSISVSTDVPTLTPTPRILQITTIDDSIMGTGPNQFNYVGNWGHCTDGCQGNPSDAYDGSNSWDNATDDYVTLTFTGVQIKFYGVLNTLHGIGAVSVDGGSETMIDFYAAKEMGDQLMWTSPTLPAGTHTLKLRVTGTKNPNSTQYVVTVDRVDILS